MATDNGLRPGEKERTEDVSFDLYRYVDGKLRIMRGVVMDRAAQLAVKGTGGTIYSVTEEHVKRALRNVLDDPEEIEQIKDLVRLPPQPLGTSATKDSTERDDDRTAGVPFSVLRYLERKMRILRGQVLQRAVQLAAKDPESVTERIDQPISPVSERHVHQVLRDMFDRPQDIKDIIGLPRESQRRARE